MKKKTQKIIICISLIVMIITSFSSVFGAINDKYSVATKVNDSALDAKIKDSILLDALANMINAIASLAESLIGGLFEVLTGDHIFPWADRIIFNAISFLDINFLNPDQNSLFGSSSSPSILGEVVQQVYATIFSLAVLFLGVAVGVMAIRLAISSIAAEKAKYKQAIVNWATCIVMLFLMHYILTFVFWINEQMVMLASSVLMNTIENENVGDVDFTEALNNLLSPEERVDNFLTAAYKESGDAANILKDNAQIASSLIMNDTYMNTYFSKHMLEEDASGDFNAGKMASNRDDWMGSLVVPRMATDVLVAKKIAGMTEEAYNSAYKSGVFKVDIGNVVYDANNSKKNPESTQYIFTSREEFQKSNEYENYLAYTLAAGLYKNSHSLEYGIGDEDLFDNFPFYKIKTFQTRNYYEKNGLYNEESLSALGKLPFDPRRQNADDMKNELVKKYKPDELENALGDKLVNDMINNRLAIDSAVLDAATGKASLSTNASDIIANLGSFFKQSAYVYETETVNENGETEKITSWRASKLSVTGALLYGIFIFQSCIYLIMYVKRLFYVIMLSMFGPLVVIYDFFMKSTG